LPSAIGSLTALCRRVFYFNFLEEDMEFGQIVSGVPLIFVVMGIVELIKAFGLQGKALTAASFAVGLALGIAYQISLGLPTGYAGWFGAVIFGLALGLMASKVYDAMKSATKAQG